MNVIGNWRARARNLRGEFVRCDACGAFASVIRRACTHCGAGMAQAGRAALPRTMSAVAFSHAHAIVETMDQIGSLRPVALARVDRDRLLALPLCETDAALAPRLVGEPLELVLRRTELDGPPDEAIAYGRKFSASAITRARLKRIEPKSK